MILYVTSFNKALYEATGKAMIESFLNTNPDAKMLVTYEGFEFTSDSDNIIPYNLSKDQWLKHWMEKHKRFIPAKYGGVDDPDIKYGLDVYFPKGADGSKPHMRAQRVQRKLKVIQFREQTARWFRKIVAMRQGLVVANDVVADYLVFVDSDTSFRGTISDALVKKTLNGKSAFVHYGPLRRHRDMGVESGFIGFDILNGGTKFLNKVFDCYQTSKFLHYKRWDDSYVFAQVMTENPKILVEDLVKKLIVEPGGHVIKFGPFCDLIYHNKGIHTRTNIV